MLAHQRCNVHNLQHTTRELGFNATARGQWRACKATAQRRTIVTAATSKKQVYLVTGASRGIGLEFVKQLLSHQPDPSTDITVVAAARAPDRCSDLCDLAKQHGGSGKLLLVRMDTTDTGSIQAAAAELKSEVGRLDVLVNNAGIAEQQVARWEKTDPAEARLVLDTNVLGPLLVTQALLPLMRASPDGRKIIAHISSALGSLSEAERGTRTAVEKAAASRGAAAAQPLPAGELPPGLAGLGLAYTVYKASKAALNMETLIMARDLAPEGFTVVSLHPGWVAAGIGTMSGAVANMTPPLTTHQSVGGMIQVISGLKPADSGCFIAHDGARVPY